MITRQINRSILCVYPEEYRAVEVWPVDPACSLGECRYWRVETTENVFCLRRWPQGKPPVEQLQFTQAVLWHAVCEGIDFVPLPFETETHQGFVTFENSFWELMPWLEGRKEFLFQPARFPVVDVSDSEKSSPVDSKASETQSFCVASALMALAQFHLAVSSFPLPHFPVSHSPKIRDLLTEWQLGLSGKFAKIEQALRAASPFGRKRLIESGQSLLDHALSYAETAVVLLSRAARLSVPIQPVVGNICDRHLCFDDDGLCGIFDFKEVGVDSVSLDVASLLASMAEADPALWAFGLKAYQRVRPLSDQERFLVDAFDRTRILLEGLDWLDQVFLREEAFSQRQIDEIARRIDRWNRRFETENRNRSSA